MLSLCYYVCLCHNFSYWIASGLSDFFNTLHPNIPLYPILQCCHWSLLTLQQLLCPPTCKVQSRIFFDPMHRDSNAGRPVCQPEKLPLDQGDPRLGKYDIEYLNFVGMNIISFFLFPIYQFTSQVWDQTIEVIVMHIYKVSLKVIHRYIIMFF